MAGILRGLSLMLVCLLAGASGAVAMPAGEASIQCLKLGPKLSLPIAARKGTRNYQAEDATAPVEKRQGLPNIGTEALEACMANWDSGTHMTKSEWREACERVTQQRAPYLQHD